MRYYSVFLAMMLALAFNTRAFAEHLSGTWQGWHYSFNFWSFEVTGSWGNANYQIKFWNSELDGTLASAPLRIKFWSSNIEGQLPCGAFRVKPWSSSVDGHICGDSFELDTDSSYESRDVAYRVVLEQLLNQLPYPVHARMKREYNGRYQRWVGE